MPDCMNAEIRDRLPELLHARLEPLARAELLMHVSQCELCAAELKLLRAVRWGVVVATPAVDFDRIAAAIPARRVASVAGGPSRVTRRLGTFGSLALAAGLGAVVLLRGDGSRSTSEALIAPTPVEMPAIPRSDAGASAAASVPVVGRQAAEEGELALAAELSEMSDGGLAALLREIESMEALPSIEPDEPLPMPSREEPAEGVER